MRKKGGGGASSLKAALQQGWLVVTFSFFFLCETADLATSALLWCSRIFFFFKPNLCRSAPPPPAAPSLADVTVLAAAWEVLASFHHDTGSIVVPVCWTGWSRHIGTTGCLSTLSPTRDSQSGGRCHAGWYREAESNAGKKKKERKKILYIIIEMWTFCVKMILESLHILSSFFISINIYILFCHSLIYLFTNGQTFF